MNKSLFFKTFCFAFAFMFVSFTAKAQMRESSIYVSGIFPVSEFNNSVELDPLGVFVPMNRDNVAMSAAVGLAATYRWGVWFNVGFGQLLPYGEVSFMWNASNRTVRDTYDDNQLNNVHQEIPKSPTYFNVPVQLGLKYRYDLTPMFRPFAELGIGYDLTFITPNGYRNNKPWYSYKPSGELCWSLGAGTYLEEFVSVGFYYMSLGRHKIDYTNRCKANLPDGEGNTYNPRKRSLGEIGIRVGFHF